MEEREKEEIRDRTDIVELVSGYTTLRKAGRTYKGLCPFHQEKTPSFTVDPERGRWHCFGSCSTGGDVFKFLMTAEGLSFPEAAERLAERAGITLTRGPGDTPDRRDERDRLYAANTLALRFFRDCFDRAAIARDYALKRGLAHETLEAFAVGFAPDEWEAAAEYLARNGCRLDDAEKAGLVSPSRRGDGYIDRFRGRLIFPIHDVQERVVAFGGRLIVPSENAPKYLNSPETPLFSKSRILYGLNRARKSIQERGRAVVVEGYMDVVAAHQAGFTEVVATLGTALTPEHVQLLGRYTKNILLSFDADEAGLRAALRAAELFQTLPDYRLGILALPAGEDPDSLLAKGKAAAFLKAIEKPFTVTRFRLRALEARYDLKDEQGREAFLREALTIVAEETSLTERDKLVDILARFHRSAAYDPSRAKQSLHSEIEQILRRRGAPEPARPAGPPIALQGGNLLPPERRPGGRPGSAGPRGAGRAGGGARWTPPIPIEPPLPPPRRSAADIAEQTVLRAFLSDEWAPSVRQVIQPGWFQDEMTVRLVRDLLVLIGGGYTPQDALAQLTDASLVTHADAILMAGGTEPLSEQAIADCVDLLGRILPLRRNNQEIRTHLADEAEGKLSADDEQLRRWERNIRAIKSSRQAEEIE